MANPGGVTHLPHTYFQNVMHVVFSTKERRKTISPQMKERLWSYTAGICKRQNVFVHAIGGVEDHIHLLLQFPATIAVAEAVKKIKANTSSWMSDEIGKFSWQEGYGAFSVSKSNMAAVQRYVQNQEKHHRRMTFEDEFITLLKKHGIDYDSRYVFG
jgi:putative transposase